MFVAELESVLRSLCRPLSFSVEGTSSGTNLLEAETVKLSVEGIRAILTTLRTEEEGIREEILELWPGYPLPTITTVAWDSPQVASLFPTAAQQFDFFARCLTDKVESVRRLRAIHQGLTEVQYAFGVHGPLIQGLFDLYHDAED